MTRARGKHGTERRVVPGTPKGDAIGLSDRQTGDASPIPGGAIHITNQPTVQQEVPIAVDRPEYRGIMAHGVQPGPMTGHERAEEERGPNTHHGPAPDYVEPVETIHPIPVYNVERAGGARPIRTIAGDQYTLPVAGLQPIMIARRDPTRRRIGLMVSPSSTGKGAMVDSQLGNVTVGGGAFIATSNGSYEWINCSDALYAISIDGSAATIYVLYEFEIRTSAP